MRIKFKTILFRSALFVSLLLYFIPPSYGMWVEEEIGNRGKKKTLKTCSALPVTSMFALEGKLKGKNQKEQIEAELGKVAQVFNPNTFDQSPQMDHITTLWEEAAKQGNFAGLYNFEWRLQRKEGEKEILPPMKQKLESYKHSINSEAFYWWHKAHTSQDARAWVKLGNCYRLGKGVKQSYQEAMGCYLKVAAQNNARAQFYIGAFYSKGLGIQKDYVKAMEWYLKAAEQNHARAQNNIGYAYYHGQGVEQDHKKAMAWYLKAAAQNEAAAQHNIGWLYSNGQGVQRDYAKAMEWSLKSAGQNHANAQYNIGLWYERGQGVQRDYAKAMEWYLKAANQNHASAQEQIGRCYKYGFMVEKDCQKAFQWFCKIPSIRWSYAFSDLGLTNENVPQLAAFLSQATLLEDLDLSRNKFTSQDLKPILDALQSHLKLIKLNVCNNLIDDEGGKELLSFFQKHLSLECLKTSGNKINEETERSINRINISKINGNSTRLSFGFDLTDIEAPLLASLLSQARSLYHIDLSLNKFTSQGIKIILEALLSCLELHEVWFACNLIDDEGGKELLLFFEKHPSLKKLLVFGNTINADIMKSIKKIAALRSSPEEIYHFTFSSCDLTDADAPQVALLLSKAHHLNEFNLDSNQFTSKGLKIILNALEAYPSLTQLDVSRNQIDDEGGKELLSFIQAHPNFKKCDVSGNPMSSEMQQSIKEALEKNENSL